MIEESIKHLQRVTWAIALALLYLASGCASPQARLAAYDAALAEKPLSLDQARICFVRKPSLINGSVAHHVVDCGTNINFDSRLIERTEITAANSGRWANVEFLIVPQDARVKLEGGVVVKPGGQKNMTTDFRTDYVAGKMYIYYKRISSDDWAQTEPNARYIGPVRSRDWLVFDRAPGLMRLKVVTLGGDEAFAPDFQVEGGKKYLVEYSYKYSIPFYDLTYCNFTFSERP